MVVDARKYEFIQRFTQAASLKLQAVSLVFQKYQNSFSKAHFVTIQPVPQSYEL